MDIKHSHVFCMKSLICIKQSNESREMNLFDSHAIEESFKLKQEFEKREHQGDFLVDVVTIGPSENSKIIKRAFGMGADRGYHVITKGRGYSFSFETASKLAVVAKKDSYDLILTGIMSQDLMAGQTGPMLAEILNLPCVTGVVKTKLAADNASIKVEQEMENGFRNGLEIILPAVLTIQPGINTPRYPTLSRMLAAGKKEIMTFDETDLFSKKNKAIQARESFVSMEDPHKTRAGHLLQGSLADKAKQLFTVLHGKTLI